MAEVVRKVRMKYIPREVDFGHGVRHPYLLIEHMNGSYFGVLNGTVATQMRKKLGLPCRKWTVVNMGLQVVES